MYCNNCGKQLPDDASFCTGCGAHTGLKVLAKNKEAGADKKRKIIVTLTAVFAAALVITGVFLYQPITQTLFHTQEGSFHSDGDIQFEFAGDLVLDDENVISVSDDGKYAVTQTLTDGDWISFHIYSNENGAYQFYKSVDFDPAAIRKLRIDDDFIKWSHDNRKFAFCRPRAIIDLQNSDIFICDIEAGAISNLTGFRGEESLNFLKGLLIDCLPAWSGDDKRIYFSRYGQTCGIYGVDIATKEIKPEKEFPEGSKLFAYWAMFENNRTLYYNTSANNISTTQGICKFQNGTETILVKKQDKDIEPIFKQVSNDGKKLLYKRRNQNDSHLDEFICIDTDTLEVITKLTPSESAGEVINAVFSPDSKTILQFEKGDSANQNVISIVDLNHPAGQKRTAYTAAPYSAMFGTESSPLNYGQLQPKWLGNGNVAVNNEKPFMLKIK